VGNELACRLVVVALCGLSACGGVASRLSDEKAGQAMRELRRDDTLAYVGWSFYCDETGVIRGRPYGRDNGYPTAVKNDPAIPSQ
jgi:hypothetical protein